MCAALGYVRPGSDASVLLLLLYVYHLDRWDALTGAWLEGISKNPTQRPAGAILRAVFFVLRRVC